MAGVFESTNIKGLSILNRFVRSATWEGMADADGNCIRKLINLMVRLAEGGPHQPVEIRRHPQG
jgi:2,4-dienoyl-CoA reductase-like NADH-dependent reductase (Old Yellow Enzyme family)